MYRASKDSVPEENRTHIRIYKCRACQHEMHLTVWSPDALTEGRSVGRLPLFGGTADKKVPTFDARGCVYRLNAK